MNSDSPPIWTRRKFIQTVGQRAPLALGALSGGFATILSACDTTSTPVIPPEPGGSGGVNRMRIQPPVAPRGLTLTAAPGTADLGGGRMSPAWMLNGSLPSPYLRVRRGEDFQVSMVNQLPQDLILHWHGMAPPEAMDGHPRFAVPPGGRYEYAYRVEDRAGTYWYHAHTHHHTAEQTFRGIGGFFIVEDDEEAALGLPSGAREIPILLQDRPLDANGQPVYAPSGPAMMAGVMGPEPFGNGTHRPFVEVDSAVYRLRILNASNARVFRLGRSDGRPFRIIGNDGGLLREAANVDAIDLAPAERLDVLLDLSPSQVGDRIMLRSLPFSFVGAMGPMGGANLQGEPMDLVEFRVVRRVQDSLTLPPRLSEFDEPSASEAQRERTFVFTSQAMSHRINGLEYDLDRIDERVPFGETEIWTFVNQSGFPHPVHLHATHFRVLSRTGGRGRLFPWEAGRKDTVLVMPQETVRVAVRFTAHRGLFLLHCHNLEHEDHAMMLNFMVE